MKGKKCYIYTRVSTAAQVEGYSLEAQQERLHKYADYKGLEIVGEYCDAGKSGHSIKGRPAFMEMMDDITSEKDEVSYVLVYKLSRFGRNAADVMKSIQLLMDYDVDLICVEDAIDSSTQGGKLTLAILSAVAEMERENINVQFSAGKMEKLAKGGWIGGTVPYGYKVVDKQLVENPVEAEMVKLIYKKFLEEGMNYTALVGWLDANGYKRVYRGREVPFRYQFIKDLLSNPVYCGKLVYKIGSGDNEKVITVQGNHVALVSEEDWNSVFKKRKWLYVQNECLEEAEGISLLAGLVKCPQCGTGLVREKNRKRNKNHGGYYKMISFYGCKNRRKSEGYMCGFRHLYHQEKLDSAVLEIMKLVTGTPEFKDSFARILGNSSVKMKYEEKLKELRKNLYRKEHLKYKLGTKLDHLDVMSADYNEQYETLQLEMNILYEEIDGLEKETEEVRKCMKALELGINTEEKVRFVLDNMDRLFEKMNFEERRELCRQFIDRIEVFPEERPDGRIVRKIGFRIPIFYGMESVPNGSLVEDPDLMVTFELDCEKLPVTVSESKATYTELQGYMREKFGLKVQTLYIAQIKRKYGINMGISYIKAADPSKHVPKCPKEKELAILDALKHYRMIPEKTEYFEG